MTLWEWMTRNVHEEAFQTGTNLGYMIGKDRAVSYIFELIDSGDLSEEECALLEAIAEDISFLGTDE